MRRACVLVFTASLIFLGLGPVFSQDQEGPAPGEFQISPETQVIAQEPNTPEMQWIWGEAVSVDAQAKAVTVKYLDYESDQEKDLAISVDDKTTYENIKSIEEIKAKDALSIDYVAMPDGKNLAKNISLEKVEEQPMPQPADVPPIEMPAQGAAGGESSQAVP